MSHINSNPCLNNQRIAMKRKDSKETLSLEEKIATSSTATTSTTDDSKLLDEKNVTVSDWYDSEDMLDNNLPTMNEKADMIDMLNNKRLKVSPLRIMTMTKPALDLPTYSDIVQPLVGKKTVLVTGGAGFIGYHVADLLLKRGDDVVIIGKCLGHSSITP